MPALPKSPSPMTKERLVEELRRNNVPLPRGRHKKEVYVELYERHILAKDDTASTAAPSPVLLAGRFRNAWNNTSPSLGFSSDDDDENVDVKIQVIRPRENKNNNSISSYQRRAARKGNQKDFADQLAEVENLSHDDLRRELISRGVKPGPIVDTTRAVYQRQLTNLLLAPQDAPGEEDENDGTAEDEYSDSDIEAGTSDTVLPADTASSSSSSTRTTSSSYKSQAGLTSVKQRRSLKKADEKSDVLQEVTAKPVTRSEKTQPAVETSKPLVPIWLQILIFVALALFLALVWYNMENSENPTSDQLT